MSRKLYVCLMTTHDANRPNWNRRTLQVIGWERRRVWDEGVKNFAASRNPRSLRLYAVAPEGNSELDHLCSSEAVHDKLFSESMARRTLEVIAGQMGRGEFDEAEDNGGIETGADHPPPQPPADPPAAPPGEGEPEPDFEIVRAWVEKEAREQTEQVKKDTGGFVQPPNEPIATIQVYEKLAAELLVPLANPAQNAFERMDVPAARKVTKGKGVKVAVLDTGCRASHPAIGGRTEPLIDATGTGGGDSDQNGHGTFCVSQVLSLLPTGEEFGVACDATVYPIQVLHSQQGWGSDSWIARGIRAAISLKVHIISMSLGGPDEMPLTLAALKEAVRAGIFIAVASGNGGPGTGDVSYPARYQEACAVGAVDDSGRMADFTERGIGLDVLACGVAQIGATGASGFGRWSGTSMACPHVASAAALFVATCLETTGKPPSPFETLNVVVRTSADQANGGGSGEARWGVVQMGKMLGEAKVDPPAPPPDNGPVDLGTVTVGDDREGATHAVSAFLTGLSELGHFTITIKVDKPGTSFGYKLPN
jgi:subtilisin family serine protease